jgi:ribosomal protein S18 acetylase RimI-like enzyme
MTVRAATESDRSAVRELVEDCFDELWERPYPRMALDEEEWVGKIVLVAEEAGEPVGVAIGVAEHHGPAHLEVIYVRPEQRGQGVARELLRRFADAIAEAGAEHLTLDVDTTNEVGRAVWRRLGFVEYARRLAAPVPALRERLVESGAGGTFGSVHAQTDDLGRVEQAVRTFVPRLGRSAGTVVVPPRNGWTGVYDELCGREPELLRRLARELSDRFGVAMAVGVEAGVVVRYVLFDRGRMVDEYLSVPEFHGPLPPGDVTALGANATLLARLTGAEPARVRSVLRTAGSPAELPPAPDLAAQVGELLGLSGVDLSYDDAVELPDALRIER